MNDQKDINELLVCFIRCFPLTITTVHLVTPLSLINYWPRNTGDWNPSF